MSVEWTREQQDSLVREMVKRPVIKGVELACAVALDWFNAEVVPDIEQRCRDAMDQAYRDGVRDTREEYLSRERDDADRTVSTPETREKALAFVLAWVAATGDCGSSATSLLGIARSFDDFITGADQ